MGDADFQIKITTQADLAALEQTKKELQAAIQQGKALGVSTKSLEASLSGVNSAIKSQSAESNSGLSSLKAKFDAAGGGARGLFAVLTSGGPQSAAALGLITAALVTAKKALAEFAEAQLNVTNLDSALAQQGILTDAYREKLQGLANQYEETTKIAGDKWLAVLTTLTKFGSDESSIEKHIEAVKNLAGLMGGDVEQSASLMGRAIAGNTSALSRYGIEIDKAKSRTEQLDSIFEQLAIRGGGQLENRVRTLSGYWEGLKRNTENLFQGFGALIQRTGIVESLITVLSSSIQVLNGFLPDTISKVDGLNNKLPSLSGGLTDAGEAAGDAASGLNEIKLAADAVKSSFDAAAESIGLMLQQADQLNDAELAAELARIDLDEERAPKNATNKARFATARAAARKDSAERKLQGKDFALTLKEEEAADAMKRLSSQRDEAGKTVAEAAGKVTAARQQAGLKEGEEFDAAKLRKEFNTNEDKIAELKKLVGSSHVIGEGFVADGMRKLQAERDALLARQTQLQNLFGAVGALNQADRNKSAVDDATNPLMVQTARTQSTLSFERRSLELERKKEGFTTSTEDTRIQRELNEGRVQETERRQRAARDLLKMAGTPEQIAHVKAREEADRVGGLAQDVGLNPQQVITEFASAQRNNGQETTMALQQILGFLQREANAKVSVTKDISWIRTEIQRLDRRVNDNRR